MPPASDAAEAPAAAGRLDQAAAALTQRDQKKAVEQDKRARIQMMAILLCRVRVAGRTRTKLQSYNIHLFLLTSDSTLI